MMAEDIAKEKDETAIREKAQKQTSRLLQREVRHKMEEEVKRLQQELETWEEDCAHFRELDAEMLLSKLHRGILRAV